MENNKNDNNYFNMNSEYPYGELPLKYTKQGQEQLKEELKRRRFAASYTGNASDYNMNATQILNTNTNQNNQNFYPNSTPNSNQNINHNNQNSNNMQNNNNNNNNNQSNAKSFVQAMDNNNQNGNGGGMDIGSLLPLLGSIGGNSDQMDSFKQLMPLLNGGANGGGQMDMNTMLKLFGGMNKKNGSNNVKTKSKVNTESKPKNEISIDDLKKVDDN